MSKQLPTVAELLGTPVDRSAPLSQRVVAGLLGGPRPISPTRSQLRSMVDKLPLVEAFLPQIATAAVETMIGDHRYPNAVMSIAEDMENQAGPKYDLSAASRRMLADLHYSYPEAGIDRLVEANGTNAMQIGFKNAFASLDVRHSPY